MCVCTGGRNFFLAKATHFGSPLLELLLSQFMYIQENQPHFFRVKPCLEPKMMFFSLINHLIHYICCQVVFSCLPKSNLPSRNKGLPEMIPKTMLWDMEGFFPPKNVLQYLRTLYILEGHSIGLNIEGLLRLPRNQQNKLIAFYSFLYV